MEILQGTPHKEFVLNQKNCQKCGKPFDRKGEKNNHRHVCLKDSCSNPIMCRKCWIRHGHNRKSQDRKKEKEVKKNVIDSNKDLWGE